MQDASDNTVLAPLAATSDALAALVERTARSSFAIAGRGDHALASAVLWRPGIAVSVAHVHRRTPAAVTLVGEGGQRVSATLAGIDSATDLAVFRLADAGGIEPVLGDAAGVRAGQLVVAVGRAADGAPCASHGIVRRVGGAWQTWLGGRLDHLIRLDGGLPDGLSGAAVADARGAVLGIASAALSRSCGVVVPASTVDRVVEQLLAKGHVARAFIGIGAQTVAFAQAMPETGAAGGEHGLLVTALVPDGPAARGGVRVGDILVSIGDAPAAVLADLRHSLADHVGGSVPVALLRGGARVELALTVGQWPTEARRC